MTATGHGRAPMSMGASRRPGRPPSGCPRVPCKLTSRRTIQACNDDLLNELLGAFTAVHLAPGTADRRRGARACATRLGPDGRSVHLLAPRLPRSARCWPNARSTTRPTRSTRSHHRTRAAPSSADNDSISASRCASRYSSSTTDGVSGTARSNTPPGKIKPPRRPRRLDQLLKSSGKCICIG